VGGVLGVLVEIIVAAITAFKVDPKRVARLVTEAIGWLVIASSVLAIVLPKAIEFLKLLLVALAG
jgi:hypothetical protein